MKILFILRDITDCGGIQQTTCININNLIKADMGFEVEVLSLYHKYEKTFFDICDKVKMYTLFENMIDTRRKAISIKNKMDTFLKEHTYDAIVIQGMGYANYISRRIWKNRDIKIIACEHTYFAQGKVGGLHWRGVRKAVKSADAIVTLTNLDAANYRKVNRRNIPIYVIYNAYVKNKGDIHYDIKSKKIVSCGTLDKNKGFDKAIKVAEKLLKKYPEWQWEIFGDGPERNHLKELIKTYNLQDKVVLKGYEQDKEKIYLDKAMFVMTSSFEGLGMVLVEALQYKLPLISFNVKYGPAEIVKNGENGELVSYNNLKELEEKIEELINNKEKRLLYSKETEKSLECFEEDNILEKWESLFREMNMV